MHGQSHSAMRSTLHTTPCTTNRMLRSRMLRMLRMLRSRTHRQSINCMAGMLSRSRVGFERDASCKVCICFADCLWLCRVARGLSAGTLAWPEPLALKASFWACQGRIYFCDAPDLLNTTIGRNTFTYKPRDYHGPHAASCYPQ